MLAGFSAQEIDDMDPDRRGRLLWRLYLAAWQERRTNPFRSKEENVVIDLVMYPPDRPN